MIGLAPLVYVVVITHDSMLVKNALTFLLSSDVSAQCHRMLLFSVTSYCGCLVSSWCCYLMSQVVWCLKLLQLFNRQRRFPFFCSAQRFRRPQRGWGSDTRTRDPKHRVDHLQEQHLKQDIDHIVAIEVILWQQRSHCSTQRSHCSHQIMVKLSYCNHKDSVVQIQKYKLIRLCNF